MILFDQIHGVGGKSQLSRSLVSFMAINLYHQANGNTYAFEAVKSWAEQAGFSSAKMVSMRVPGCGLITLKK